MKKEEYTPIETNISFADAALKAFDFKENDRTLNIFLESWNEQKIKISFKNILYFECQPGDFVSEIYYVLSESSILQESLHREYGTIPNNHNYRLVVIKDIDDISVSTIICNNIFISICEN